MNHHTIIYSGTAVFAAVGIGLGAAACGSASASTVASNGSSARYYQEGYRYARANISPAQYQILSHSGYEKWCASASSATSELKRVHGPTHSKAASQWVKGCSSYAARDGLQAKASPAPAAPSSPPPSQAPSQGPSQAPTNSNPQPSQPTPSPPQPPPYCDPSTGQCQQAPAPPPGGFPGGSENPCNGPDASQLGDCVPGGGINGGQSTNGG